MVFKMRTLRESTLVCVAKIIISELSLPHHLINSIVMLLKSRKLLLLAHFTEVGLNRPHSGLNSLHALRLDLTHTFPSKLLNIESLLVWDSDDLSLAQLLDGFHLHRLGTEKSFDWLLVELVHSRRQIEYIG